MQMMTKYPSAILAGSRDAAGESHPANGQSANELDLSSVEKQLQTLGFRPAHIKSASRALLAANIRMHSLSTAMNDPLVLSLSMLSPLEAGVEWLLLHVPEDDLPIRFRPSKSSSNFITGAQSFGPDQNGLTRGWTADKLVKAAGFPRKVVEQVLNVEHRESLALDVLGCRLCGWPLDNNVSWRGNAAAREQRALSRSEESLAIEAVLGERYCRASQDEIVITIDSAASTDRVALHIIEDDAHPYPSTQYPRNPPAFFISSDSVPAYMRLHLHKQLLLQFRDPNRFDLNSILEAGHGGAILPMVDFLEEWLPKVVEQPPDVGIVTEHLAPKTLNESSPPNGVETPGMARQPIVPKSVARSRPPRMDDGGRSRKRAMLEDRRYPAMQAEREKLPAWNEKDRINALLEHNRVIVVVGETGCGKSTQLPQFILDHEIDAGRGGFTDIIITQPRRVAAMGVASRVAQERLEDIEKKPESVGYAIRGERRVSSATRLLFCTTGVLLRRLGLGDKDLEGVSHVVIDEAHERGVETDLLICLLRDLLERNKTLKIVLMSATINEKIFIDYFRGCPSLQIPGFTHPVQDYFVEDIVSQLDYVPQPNRFGPRQSEEQKMSLRNEFATLSLSPDSQRTLELLAASDRIDYVLVASVVRHVTAKSLPGAILIFMPGVMEIRLCMAELAASRLGPVEILPLHANLTTGEQRRVFLPAGSKRKIVVATNVAETSITIPDVVYVIDTGRVKETQYDISNGLQRLDETWTSRASGRQRRGRAGRTQPGQCYKLYTRRTERDKMSAFSVPEILRTPLDSLVLQVKAMNEDIDVGAFLRRAIDPPHVDALAAAWQTLQDLGAIEGEDRESRLTALGRHMSMIPVDLRLAKMLVLGTIFKCLDPVLTIAAILSSKPLFTSPIDKRDDAKRAREAFSRGRSDLLTDAYAYEASVALRSKGESAGALRQYCEQVGADHKHRQSADYYRTSSASPQSEMSRLCGRTSCLL